VATGQNGLQPLVYIWDAVSAERLGQIKLPKGTRAVSALGFSRTSQYLAVSDMHNDHNIYCYNLDSNSSDGTVVASLLQGYPKLGGTEKIFMIQWSLSNDEFCSVGPKHICFWSLTGKPKKGTFGDVMKVQMVRYINGSLDLCRQLMPFTREQFTALTI
jgi:hypothetical protein